MTPWFARLCCPSALRMLRPAASGTLGGQPFGSSRVERRSGGRTGGPLAAGAPWPLRRSFRLLLDVLERNHLDALVDAGRRLGSLCLRLLCLRRDRTAKRQRDNESHCRKVSVSS